MMPSGQPASTARFVGARHPAPRPYPGSQNIFSGTDAMPEYQLAGVRAAQPSLSSFCAVEKHDAFSTLKRVDAVMPGRSCRDPQDVGIGAVVIHIVACAGSGQPSLSVLNFISHTSEPAPVGHGEARRPARRRRAAAVSSSAPRLPLRRDMVTQQVRMRRGGQPDRGRGARIPPSREWARKPIRCA